MAEPASDGGSEVLFEMHGRHVAIVTLNRPQARNAINGAAASSIARLVRRTEDDPEVRVVVLASSHETVFCAGADLVEIANRNADKLSTSDGGFAGLTEARRSKLWIAAVRGAALAGGCELALACDMIVASEDGRFGLPEVKRGLYAGAAGVYRLPARLPLNIALEIIATGDPIDARRCFALGLVNRVVPGREVLSASLQLAEAVAANAPLSVKESVAVACLAPGRSEDELRPISREASDRVFASEDAKEGPRAFLEKREPRWAGR